MPRHNPFNRASLIVVEPPEMNELELPQQQESSETDPISPLISPPAAESSQTSAGSVTSESSPVGFRPVPKKRTFLSRQAKTEGNEPGSDPQVGSAGIVPTPRRSLQGGSSESSNQSNQKSLDEMPPRSVASNQASQSDQSSKSLDEIPQQPPCDISQVLSNSSPERETNPPSLRTDKSLDVSSDTKILTELSFPSTATQNLLDFRPATSTRSDAATDREIPQKSDERDDHKQIEHAAIKTLIMHADSTQDTDRENCSSVGTSTRQGELSLPQSTVDPEPPISYDLNFIDKSHLQTQTKSNPNDTFQLSTQTASPTGEEEDSIAKVLDWFNRSTDSNDWLNTDDGPKVKKSSDKHVEKSKVRGEDVADSMSNRKKESVEMKRSPEQRQRHEAKELRAVEKIGNKELSKPHEEVKKESGERMRSKKVKEDKDDESESPQISDLKSFWEKNNAGPKILVSNSIKPGDKGQKSAHLSAEKDKEKMNKTNRESDMPSVPGINHGKGSYDEYQSNPRDEREKQGVMSPQKDNGHDVHLNFNQAVESLVMNTSTQRNNNDLKLNSDHLRLASRPQVSNRRSSDTEILSVSRLSPRQRKNINSRLSPESERISLAKPSQQPDSISQSREPPQQAEMSRTVHVSQLGTDTDFQTRESTNLEELFLLRNNTHMDDQQGGNDVQIASKTQMRRGLSEDTTSRDSEDDSIQLSPKRKQDTPIKDRVNSLQSNRQGLQHQEVTAEKIKQLKSFWEQERNKPMFYKSKPKVPGEGKVARGASQAKLNKRFTKSEFDLTSIVRDASSDEDDYDRNNTNFTVLPLNQRLDKSSPSLGTSRMQFKTLREFWDEATADAKGLSSSDKPKSQKKKEPITAQTSLELKCADPEVSRASAAFEKTRPGVTKVSSPPQNRSKSPHDRQMGSRAVNNGKSNFSRSSKDSNKEEKSMKPQHSSTKETRSPKSRKDAFGGRNSSLRRSTSMFALSAPDKNDHMQLKMDVSPVHSRSRKQRQNAEEGTRRSSEETETPTPRARAYVPTDYRHYLGMTDNTSANTSLDQTLKDEGSEGKFGYEFDLGGPMKASTPMSSEDRDSRRGSKTGHRPLWATYSSSDTGQDSSMSSMSETWSVSRNSSNRENDDENRNPVRKALRRAETRPKNLAKSLEDITGSLSPRQERRQDPTADTRRISEVSVSTIPSTSSSIYSDAEHLKKMSKSVPSFLQKEDVGTDTDSNYGDTYRRGKLMTDSSFADSSGRASLSSLSGSVMTMYSGDFANVEVQGNIQFSINYVQKLREFHIFVVECRDLAAVDPKRGRSDPYVKSYLAPDKANLGKRKTSVKKKTLNPTFNEILRYRVRMEYLRTQTLILSVWHNDTFGRNSFLGEVDMDLSKWDFDHTQMNYLPLKARTTHTLPPSTGRGEMRLAIRFLPQIIHSEGLGKEAPSTGEVHIWVKECKNLPLIRTTIDPYVKCFVLPDTSRKSRQKTRVLRRTVDPAFNHTMVYDGIREADLAEACVELTVWDRDRLASNLLGGLRLGPGTGRSYGAPVDWMDSTPFEVALWERMKATPNEWVEDVIPIRMINSSKSAFK
uniref:uncharacterized protein n=1 Tax=Semicossyphus pulcher TaxID=241346 RepID=UPI0037E9298D